MRQNHTNQPGRSVEPQVEILSGLVERLTYFDARSGFSVARVRIEKNDALVTVVGDLMVPPVGTFLRMEGHWVRHARFGRQFKVLRHEARVPATSAGIARYLGSGWIEGLGPAFAERIVEHFGEQTLDILEHRIERLQEVNGIGKKRLERIRKAWHAQKHTRDGMIFLQSQGIGAALAGKILRHYGRQTMAVVQADPYRLAGDVQGVGFLTADRIARRLGFDIDSPQRIQAGILHVLRELTSEGHVYCPHVDLTLKCRAILDAEREQVLAGIAALAAERRVIIEDLNDDPDRRTVYLPHFHASEISIARRIQLLCDASRLRPEVDARCAVARVQGQLELELAEQQSRAAAMALKEKVLVITGGPGTGKTTIIQAITRLYQQLHAAVCLAAPTGRAAKRLSEATGHTAKTLHRLLEYSPMQGGFQRNDENPLKCELLVVDEASMIDVLLMHHLLKAVPLNATLVLVGDVNQLPPVGPGNVLKDIIDANRVPVVVLDRIFRQSRTSRIVVNAHRINAGHMPLLGGPAERKENDFFFIEQNDPDKILEIILQLTAERIPRRFGLDPVNDIQVLTPMHRGTLGADNLNRQLQAALNPQQVYVMRGKQMLQIEDKVMQIRNDYNKEVFNGDIGRIAAIDARTETLTVRFEERSVAYDFTELDAITPAYAVSIHKAQGSEFPAVVIPVTTQHYVLLQRNLIYTGITRARRLVVLVGSRRALAMAIRNNAPRMRYTQLRRRLEAVQPGKGKPI